MSWVCCKMIKDGLQCWLTDTVLCYSQSTSDKEFPKKPGKLDEPNFKEDETKNWTCASPVLF